MAQRGPVVPFVIPRISPTNAAEHAEEALRLLLHGLETERKDWSSPMPSALLALGHIRAWQATRRELRDHRAYPGSSYPGVTPRGLLRSAMIYVLWADWGRQARDTALEAGSLANASQKLHDLYKVAYLDSEGM